MSREREGEAEKIDLPRETNREELPENAGLALLPHQMTSAAACFASAVPLEAPAQLRSVRAASTSEGPSDSELVSGIRRGDTTLGRFLYRRLIRVVESTLTRVLGRAERDHDDLVQAVFEEVVRSIHSGRFELRCALTSWAATIACHVGLNAIRSRRMERTVFDRDHVIDAAFEHGPSGPQPERALAARDELRQLRLTLAAMPEGRSEAVLMHDVLGYGLAEIAQINGSTVAAVQSRLVRGRKELAERLELQKRAETAR